ncbi:MAG: hypothetical protein HY863_06205 [Chloroflexi bacterium]|nr:hypothetical protein [Chloroflexota bacterium]
MNRKFFLTLTIIALMISACASNSTAAVSSTSTDNSLPMQSQLILGTLKLEETANAVTAEQAAELLPMWYVLKELNSSTTAAQDEVESLVSQIQAALTKEQLKAITDMKLGAQDMMAAMQQNAGTVSSGSGSSQAGSTFSAAGDAAGGPPDMPAGGMPAGGDPAMAPIDAAVSNENSTTTQPAMSGTPSALFDAVIELLKAKAE